MKRIQFTHQPKQALRTTAIAVAIALLAACASREPDPALVQARQTVDSAAQDPSITRYAQQEMARARAALQSAEQAQSEGLGEAEVAHRAYIAQRLAAAAQATANARVNDERLQQASAARERVRLQARERETQQAQQQAQSAQQQAQSAQQQAEQLRQQAQTESQRSQQLQQQLQDLQARQTQRGTVVTLGDVLFDTGRAELKAGSLRSIERLAGALKANPERRVKVEGFTDSTGSDELNRELSQRRAEAVERALVQMGVDDGRIEARGYGEEYPVADNDTASGRQMNRRVEIVISDPQGNIGERTNSDRSGGATTSLGR
jgi:outer membrane protein OmpA-like peptidoglycan-associated protein